VPIREIIEQKYGSVFEPEDIPSLVGGYEAALRKLGLVDRKDPMTLTVHWARPGRRARSPKIM
jgi:hypothetical protein